MIAAICSLMSELVNARNTSNEVKEADTYSKKTHQAEYRSIIGDLSFSVCLPKKYSQDLGLHKGDYVRVTQEDGKIMIQKAD
jgi:formylmethanofuran dehydrogenase subunit D